MGRQSIYFILEIHYQIHFSLFITKQLLKYTHGNRNTSSNAKQEQQIEYLIW